MDFSNPQKMEIALAHQQTEQYKRSGTAARQNTSGLCFDNDKNIRLTGSSSRKNQQIEADFRVIFST